MKWATWPRGLRAIANAVAIAFVLTTSVARHANAAAPAPKGPTPAPKARTPATADSTPARKESTVAPGTPSRWSNRGAMTPIVSEVPVGAPLPARSVPVGPGVETPGQRLVTTDDERISARFSLYGYHMETVRQDVVYLENAIIPDVSRDIDLYRGRASMAYERIGGSSVGLRLDLEYRARSSGSRPTDRRINELYLSYGLTDSWRSAEEGFGIAAGRIAVREAGSAQADGLLLRMRFSPDLSLGLFGGFSGNPYNYNWRLRMTEDFSTKWVTAGGFGGLRTRDFSLDGALVLTTASIRAPAGASDPGVPNGSGVDRFYAFLDGTWTITPEFNALLSGWFDAVPSGQILQNFQAALAWTPNLALNLRLGGGRFTTVRYKLSTDYSFVGVPGTGLNPRNENSVIVDEGGQPVVPFNEKLLSATYNQAYFRAGVRVSPAVELFGRGELMIRESEASDGEIAFPPLRLFPSLGARYTSADLFDAFLRLTMILDDQTDTNFVLHSGVARGFYGLYLSADVQAFFGGVFAADGGLEVSYTIPRDEFFGRLTLRAMFRYFRESVSLTRPDDALTEQFVDQGAVLPLVPLQESYLGFAGVEWRF